MTEVVKQLHYTCNAELSADALGVVVVIVVAVKTPSRCRSFSLTFFSQMNAKLQRLEFVRRMLPYLCIAFTGCNSYVSALFLFSLARAPATNFHIMHSKRALNCRAKISQFNFLSCQLNSLTTGPVRPSSNR